jgi:hypothetical protein
LRLGNSLTLPIYWDKYEYVAYDYIFSQLDLEEAKDKLLGGLNDKLLELMDQTGEILYRHISYQQQDNTLIAVFHAVVEENIIKSRPLLQEELIPQKLDDEQASLMTDFNG